MAPTLTSWPLCHHLLFLTHSAHFTPCMLASWLSLKHSEHSTTSQYYRTSVPFPWATFPPDICVLGFLTSLRSWPQHFLPDILITLRKTIYLLNISHPFFPAQFIPLAFIVHKFNYIRDFFFFVCVFKMILAHVSHHKYLLDKADCPVVLPGSIIFLKYFSYSCSKQHVGTVLKPKEAFKECRTEPVSDTCKQRVGLRENFNSQCCCSRDGS